MHSDTAPPFNMKHDQQQNDATLNQSEHVYNDRKRHSVSQVVSQSAVESLVHHQSRRNSVS